MKFSEKMKLFAKKSDYISEGRKNVRVSPSREISFLKNKGPLPCDIRGRWIFLRFLRRKLKIILRINKILLKNRENSGKIY